MKNCFAYFPIKKKFTVLMFINTGIMMVLISVVFIVYETITLNQDIISELSTIAKMIGINSASAITFNDPDYAGTVLSSLHAEPYITKAAIFLTDGKLFVEYNDKGQQANIAYDLMEFKHIEKQDIFKFMPIFKKHYCVFEPIIFEGEILGTVYISSKIDKLLKYLKTYLLICGIMLLTACFMAYFLSSKLQKIISAPILNLAKMMNMVSEKKDYTIRTDFIPNDEMGILFNGFNEMLTQIQLRDEKLEKHRENLEEMVYLRTAELQKSMQQLKIAKEAAEAASIAKSQFLANMSHEIRTPMNGVLGIIELLAAGELSENQKKLTDTMRCSGENLMTIINEILDFSKIEAGKLKLVQNDFNLYNLVEETIELFTEKVQSKGLKLTCFIDNKLNPNICGDADRLRQILINLISNAVKFTHKGGIVVSVNFIEEHEQLENIEFEVKDTGIGIAKEIQSLIFDPFSQADGSLTRDYQGTGLGLSIVRQLVEMMNGNIYLESELGKGTRFWFDIWVRKSEKIHMPLNNIEKEDTWYKSGDNLVYKILLAEDNQVNQIVAKGVLESLKCLVDVASNGHEAKEMFKHSLYDMIFMDCQMPQLDGYSATQEIRKYENEFLQSHHTPIIALTAHAMKSDRQKCLDAGMDDYISKPFTPSQLQAVLDKWLSSKDVPSVNDSDLTLTGKKSEKEKSTSVNVEVLNNIRALQRKGQPDLLTKVIFHYLDNTPKLLEELTAAINEKDSKMIEETAHSLKSSSGNVGAMPLFDLCKELEAVGREQNFDLALNIFEKINNEYERVKIFLEQEIEKHHKGGKCGT